MNYVDFGRRVKHLRKQQGITQKGLAIKVGISASFLGHIERGTRVASLETLVKLCHTLNTYPSHLLAFSLQQEEQPFPSDLTEETRKQLMELLYQGYLVLQGNTK